MPKILFFSEACLLDRKSGAAQSARAMLGALVAKGWQARAVTLNVCDGDTEAPLGEQYPELAPSLHAGQAVVVQDGGLQHDVWVTHSTRQRRLRPWDLREFHALAQGIVQDFQPDVLLTYCSELSHPVLAFAQRQGVRTVFYIANAGFAKQPENPFKFIDDHLVPSRAMADLYRSAFGIEAQVVGDIVDKPLGGRLNLDPVRVGKRQQRFVTMINPEPRKGGLFFINLAAQASVLAPDVKFRALESRWGRSDWVKTGVPAADLDRIDWQPSTHNMAPIWNETALLLVPSLGFEASARVIAEALLAGVPVLAMRSGGIAEQLNQGGFLFDLPKLLADNPLAAPDKVDLLQWVKFIKVLMDDDALYGRAVTLALQAAAKHEPASAAESAVSLFEGLAGKSWLPTLPLEAALDERLEEAVRQLRQRMNALRQSINEQVEASQVMLSDKAVDTPYLELFQLSLAQPAIQEALVATNSGDSTTARHILEPYLRLMPDDVTALGLLAEVADAQEREVEARQLLERVVTLAPGFVQGQRRLFEVLRRSGDVESALVQSFELLERAPHQPRYLALHAGLLVTANRFADAIAVYGAFLKQNTGAAQDWMQYALALKTLGRQEDAITAYRRATELSPSLGAAWHGMSNMKLAVFTPADIVHMKRQLARDDLPAVDLLNLHFALGKALEDRREFEPSFTHYASANRLRRSQSDYDVGRLEEYVAQSKAFFTPAFFADRAGLGHSAQDPVFVLGLHRAGSTLVEQMLASHSRVEGTRELPYVLRLGRDFGGAGLRGQGEIFNGALLADLSGPELAQLGRQYMTLSASDRHTQRPMFVDKMPGNWMHTGLIHLMLPNAKIIDIRRQPMAAGFALFKMNFGQGAEHSYDQQDIARYYRAYADLMAHVDTVLPGRVHRIQYDNLVENTEAEIRRLLAYCGLPFEDSCLRYWETERAIQTPSSEQVRQPIFSSAVEQWQNYAEWLGPMQEVFSSDASP